ncbi:M23 family metallopeptidase [Paenibacillus alvei]|uniref:M23 family metallopeptidase n=1 Tax=Paenibacillus alvei TaxID=44250 RepID=UPI002280EA7A|nr:M23 family metallopeptidase [Paenibacillus alvei]MCY7485368.1 peptidoglycan DD-metalloendopeptidase family protein [Paenibacillus alvei]
MAQANDRRWTWMLMRGPNRPVIQYSVPTVVVRLVMFIVIGGVGALFLSLVIQRFAMHDIVVRHAQLEQELQKKDQLLADMDKQLTIITASSNDMKQRMDKISQWEQQLQSYLQIPTGTGRQKNNNSISKTSHSTTNSAASKQETASLPPLPLGGEYIMLPATKLSPLLSPATESKGIIPPASPLAAWVSMSKQLQDMNKKRQEWEQSMPQLFKNANAFQRQLNATPTLWPTESTRITSLFGERSDPFQRSEAFHAGLDIGGDTGDPVYATAEGVVLTSDRDELKGNYIIISHGNGLTTRYLHLSERMAASGDKVKKGTQVGKVGTTGRSTGPHLHFEIRKDGEPIDPTTYVGTPE